MSVKSEADTCEGAGMLERHLATLSERGTDPRDPRLLVGGEGRLSIHYAPFDHVNPQARIAIVGITPGAHQAGQSIRRLRERLEAGDTLRAASMAAKEFASFSGPMRDNLVDMLDFVGVGRWLGLQTCRELWEGRTDLVHFTSAIRYPTFRDGENYSGSPAIGKSRLLRDAMDRWFAEELAALPDALWIPLGDKVAAAIRECAARASLSPRLLDGLPHPSGANGERIAYFLGRKERSRLSAKTNPDAIDRGRRAAEEAVRKLV